LVGIGQIVAQVPDLPAGDYAVVIAQENLSSNVVAASRPTKGGVRPATPRRLLKP
jgi:hypothetical protein